MFQISELLLKLDTEKKDMKETYRIFGPRREKTCLQGFQQSKTQPSQLSYRD